MQFLKTILKKTTVAILTLEARLILKKYKPKVVAITGTVGKTSAKDAIYAVLSHFYTTRKSEKSFNSEIGVPLTVIGCPNAWNNPLMWLRNFLDGLSLLIQRKPYPEWLVLEVGADRPGDIKKTASWIKPDIAIITRLSKVPAHVEFFESPESVKAEKGELAHEVSPNGTLILNGDDEDVMSLKEKTKARTESYGFSKDATLVASYENIEYQKDDGDKYPLGITFRVDSKRASIPVHLAGGFGMNHIYAALAALAVADVCELNMVRAAEALHTYEMAPGRLKLIKGVKDSIIIDDTYNASPVAMESALDTLSKMKCDGRKIAVLGEMLELGKHASDEHRRMGEIAGKICNMVITVGIRARHIAEGALIAGLSEKKIFQFENSVEAGKFLEQKIKAGDIALVKGSQGVRMERAVLEVMAEPEKRKELLVRQEDEWNSR